MEKCNHFKHCIYFLLFSWLAFPKCIFILNLFFFFNWYSYKRAKTGVPSVAQWVKHLTAAVWMAEELWVRFLAQSGGLKGSSASLLRLGFNPLPRNFAGATIKLKKKKTNNKKQRQQTRNRQTMLVWGWVLLNPENHQWYCLQWVFAHVFLFFSFCLFAISWAACVAYGGSQARGRIRAVATGLR